MKRRLLVAAAAVLVILAAMIGGGAFEPATYAGGTIMVDECFEVLSVDEAEHVAHVRAVPSGDDQLDEYPELELGSEGELHFDEWDDLPQPGEQIVVGWLVSVHDDLTYPVRVYTWQTLDEYLREQAGYPTNWETPTADAATR